VQAKRGKNADSKKLVSLNFLNRFLKSEKGKRESIRFQFSYAGAKLL
jgi:hypothetical protein